MKDTVIIYHGECPDGFGAAWAAHKKFGNEAEYIPAHHGHLIPEGLVDKTIYLLDFTYPEDIISKLIKANKRVTAIDHHVSREVAIKMTQDYAYAVNNSGSVMAWMYFHADKPIPKMLQYIEDRDIWKWKLEHSESICTFIDSFSFDLKEWDKLAVILENDIERKEAITKGDIMLRHEWRLMERVIKENTKMVTFEGYEVYALNAPGFSASYICNALLKRKGGPFAITWVEQSDEIHVSLRSGPDFDVSKLAGKFGGGGHKGAAGFDLPSINSFPWKEVK